MVAPRRESALGTRVSSSSGDCRKYQRFFASNFLPFSWHPRVSFSRRCFKNRVRRFRSGIMAARDLILISSLSAHAIRRRFVWGDIVTGLSLMSPLTSSAARRAQQARRLRVLLPSTHNTKIWRRDRAMHLQKKAR